MYLAYCEFDPERIDELPRLRAAHLQHVLAHRDRIEFGGLVGVEGDPPEALVLFMRAGSAADVEAVVRADPYSSVWRTAVVREFQRRVPEAYDGQLADMLERLTTVSASGRPGDRSMVAASPEPDDPDVRRARWRGLYSGERIEDVVLGATDAPAAVIDASGAQSSETLRRTVREAALQLQDAGLRTGQIAVLHFDNTPSFLVALLACLQCRVIPLLALPSHARRDIEHLGTTAGASAYVFSDDGNGERDVLARRLVAGSVVTAALDMRIVDQRPSVRALHGRGRAAPERAPAGSAADDIALLLVSGGTTGLPKLIPRTHDDYVYNIRLASQRLSLVERDRYLAALPVAHNFGLACPGALGALAAGGTVVFPRSPSPKDCLRTIEEAQITVTAVVPTQGLLWARATRSVRADTSSLRALQVGGSRLTPAVASEIAEAFPGRLQQSFGMAEGFVSQTSLADPPGTVLGTQGKPLSPFDEFAIVDEHDVPVEAGAVGHLLVRGPYTISGYYDADDHNASAFTADGYYRTGDLASVDPHENLVIEGRSGDVIHRGGEKIGPEDVEECVLRFPGVRDAAVVGVDHGLLGQAICTFIVTDSSMSLDELRQFLLEQGLAKFKLPDRLELVAQIPRTGIGKTDRRALQALVG